MLKKNIIFYRDSFNKMQLTLDNLPLRIGKDIFQRYWYNLKLDTMIKDGYYQRRDLNFFQSLENGCYHEVLGHSFDWAETQEGEEYWDRIYEYLKRQITININFQANHPIFIYE